MADTHAYNHPGLSPLQFLQAVYTDPTVDISHRVLAAYYALLYTTHPQGLRWEDRDPMDRVTIVIGGLPEGTSVSVHQGQEPTTQEQGPTDHPPPIH